MPVDQNGVGISPVTGVKQAHFRTLIRAHIGIVQAIQRKYSWVGKKYLYFDINSGPGIYDDGEKGSPVIFLDEIENVGMDYQAILIDINENNVEKLRDVTGDNKRVTIVCEDNATAITRFYNSCSMNDLQYGILYTDPNGTFNSALLGEFSSRFNKIDLLINCPATAIKRERNCSKCDENRTLVQRLEAIRKKHWLVRKKLPNSTYQWTFLLGSNWDNFPEFRNLGMFKCNSRMGKQILGELNLTASELEEFTNLSLFNQSYSTYEEYLGSYDMAAIRKQVYQRCNGICEQCHTAMVTECHHIRYPKWYAGEIDVPDNLLGLCHECHCAVHGVEGQNNLWN